MPTRFSRSSPTFAKKLVGGTVAGSQDPAPLNTTMSPRSMGRKRYTILLTRMRSPTCRVFSIDPEGMENTWTTNDFSRIVRTRAATTITPRSRQKDRLRLRGAVGSSAAGVGSGSIWVSARQRSAGGRGLPALLDPRGLTAQVAQVVELGTADAATGDGLDLVNRRAVHRERALDANAVADLPHGEGLPQATALATDHDTLENLDAGAVAFRHLYVHLQGVTRAEVRNVSPDLGLLKLGDRGVHGGCFLSPGRNARQRASGG